MKSRVNSSPVMGRFELFRQQKFLFLGLLVRVACVNNVNRLAFHCLSFLLSRVEK